MADNGGKGGGGGSAAPKPAPAGSSSPAKAGGQPAKSPVTGTPLPKTTGAGKGTVRKGGRKGR